MHRATATAFFPIVLAISALIPNLARGEVIHVPGEYATIQAAIDAADHGDVVLVADGTYKGPENRNIDFKGKAITLRSENGAHNCVIDCKELGRCFYIHLGEGRDTVIEGFTVLHGMVETGFRTGQGILIQDSSPTILDCRIRECGFYYYGEFTGPDGGGIAVERGSPLIQRCLIEDNTATLGGGIYCFSAQPQIVGCRILNNLAKAYIDPGIMFPYHEGDGGGLYLEDCRGAICHNCLIEGNSSGADYRDSGGGFAIYLGTGRISNCTLSENDGSGDIFIAGTHAYEITNTIVWYSLSYHPVWKFACLPLIHHCNIEGGYPGTGNINAPPGFEDMSGGDYSLGPRSPCIDAGDPDNTLFAGCYEDINQSPRIVDGDLDQEMRIDMGAFEFNNTSIFLEGAPLPGHTVQLVILGKQGLHYLVVGGVHKALHPPLIDPFGYLLIDLHPALTPVIPMGTIPAVVNWIVPSKVVPGTSVYLQPVCWEEASGAGNLGSLLEVVVQ